MPLSAFRPYSGRDRLGGLAKKERDRNPLPLASQYSCGVQNDWEWNLKTQGTPLWGGGPLSYTLPQIQKESLKKQHRTGLRHVCVWD